VHAVGDGQVAGGDRVPSIGQSEVSDLAIKHDLVVSRHSMSSPLVPTALCLQAGRIAVNFPGDLSQGSGSDYFCR